MNQQVDLSILEAGQQSSKYYVWHKAQRVGAPGGGTGSSKSREAELLVKNRNLAASKSAIRKGKSKRTHPETGHEKGH